MSFIFNFKKIGSGGLVKQNVKKNSGLICCSEMSLLQGNLSSGGHTRSDTNRAVHPQKVTRGFKFQIEEVKECYYLLRSKGILLSMLKQVLS